MIRARLRKLLAGGDAKWFESLQKEMLEKQ